MSRTILIFAMVLAISLFGCETCESPDANVGNELQRHSEIAWGETVSGLQIGLTMAERIFKTGQPVRLSYHLRNVGQDTIFLVSSMDQPRKPHVDVQIQDARGKTIFESHDMQSWVRFMEIEPGETISATVIPSSLEMLPEVNELVKGTDFLRAISDNDSAILTVLPSGMYKVSVVYSFGPLDKPGTYPSEWEQGWSGTSRSSDLSFEIR